MAVSVILAHPNRRSFNHAIASTCVDVLLVCGHAVHFHDPYAEQFDPILPFREFRRGVPLPKDIEDHCSQISDASGIVIIHPNWWGQPPAILKGWIDRIIRPGVACEFLEGDTGEGVPKGLLKTRSAVVFNTSNTDSRREAAVFGDPLQLIWKNCVFDLCGVTDFHRRVFGIVVTSTEAQRRVWLTEVEDVTHSVFRRVT